MFHISCRPIGLRCLIYSTQACQPKSGTMREIWFWGNWCINDSIYKIVEIGAKISRIFIFSFGWLRESHAQCVRVGRYDSTSSITYLLRIHGCVAFHYVHSNMYYFFFISEAARIQTIMLTSMNITVRTYKQQFLKMAILKNDILTRTGIPANSHALGVRLTQSPKKTKMREIFAPISTISYILSLIYQLPQNQISRIAPLLGWQVFVQVCLHWCLFTAHRII